MQSQRRTPEQEEVGHYWSVWFMSSVLLVYLLDFKAEFIWMAAFRVYHLLAFGIMAIWLAIGAAWAAGRVSAVSPILGRQAGIFILTAVVGLTAAAHWEKNNRREYDWSHNLAVAKLKSVEPNAVLFTFDDLDLPVGYLHFVEGMRPDLKVYNDQGLVYGDRLYSPLMQDYAPPQAPNAQSKHKILRSFVERVDRPIYYHTARQKLYAHPRFGSDFMGFFRRVNREGAHERIILSDSLKIWLQENISLHGEIVDLWTRQQHFATVSQLVNAVQLASYHGLEITDEWRELIDRALDKNALARLSSNSQRLTFRQIDEEGMRRELEWMKKFEPTDEPLLGRQLTAIFYWQKALFARTLGDESVPVEETLLLGSAANVASDNPASQELILLYRNEERHCELITLTESLYPDPDKIPRPMLASLRQARNQGQC